MVCVCYSTVNIGKCKQQVTEILLHLIDNKVLKIHGVTSDGLLNSLLLAV
jgi:hypothetical protein